MYTHPKSSNQTKQIVTHPHILKKFITEWQLTFTHMHWNMLTPSSMPGYFHGYTRDPSVHECEWFPTFVDVHSYTRFFRVLKIFSSNVWPKDFVRHCFVTPEFAHICATKWCRTKSFATKIGTIPKNMPTNFEATVYPSTFELTGSYPWLSSGEYADPHVGR